MSQTALNLFRSLRTEQFPHGLLIDNEPAPGLLHPDFYQRPLPSGEFRKADVDMLTDANGVEWVKAGGGTSLFDRANIFTKDGWLCFTIPEGTVIPPSLIIRATDYNKRFKATHYQIEARAKLMTKAAMEAALENLARNAVVRAIELAKIGSNA